MKRNFSENTVLKLSLVMFLTVFGMSMPTNLLADASSSFIQNNVDGSQTLTGHVPLDIKSAILQNHASRNISAQIIMPLSNQSQLTTLLKGIYDPSSPNYHHFLTPTQFTQQFASSTIDSAAIQEYLNKEGILVSGKSPNGTILNVVGPVSAFEQAFGLQINNYQKSDGTLFFATNANPKIPTNLSGKILAIGGLDNLPKYKAHVQQLAGVLPKAAGTGPGGFLAPNDVLTAYNLNAVSANGSGQTIGLFELQGYSKNDITAYEAKFSLPNVPLQNVIVDGFNGVDFNNGADEVTLDIEIAAAVAPGSSINVYEAPNTTQSWIDEWNAIAASTVKIISCSWGEPELDSPTLNFDNTMAVDEPADQPFVTGVGISKLTTASNGAYSSESASLYGGGGVSAVWSIPAYQTTAASQAIAAAKVSTTMRNMPDVSLTADLLRHTHFISMAVGEDGGVQA